MKLNTCKQTIITYLIMQLLTIKRFFFGVPQDRSSWHAGDGSNGYGNRNHISFEICYSKSGGKKYKKAEANAVKVLAYALYIKKWGMSKLKKHQDWSGKNCPHRILDEKRWDEFYNKVAKELDRLNGKARQVSKPNPTPAPSKPVVKPFTNQTTSIVDYLNGLKINSSSDNRKKLAVEYGVKNYDLSAAKNTELLDKMRAGKPVNKPAAKPKPTPAPKGKTLYLPKSATSWRVYSLNKAPVAANALKTRLNPKKFGGLNYKIIANPQKDVYTIQTQQLGRVNIYAGPGTGAVIK